MTVPASTVPTARAALKALIAADATISADPTIQVIYDDPGPGDTMHNDLISVGSVQQTEEPFALVGSGGMGWTKEQFSIEVVITCFQAGDEAQTVWERCYTLINAVRTATRSDPTISGTVSQSWPASWEVESSWAEDGSGRYVVGRGQIHCMQQL